MARETTRRQKIETCWTPRLIRRLRSKRTQAEFGTLLGTSKNTVWRWEAGQARPDAGYAGRLTELAERERFLTDWQLVGSMLLVGDLESARADIAALFRTSLGRTSRQLVYRYEPLSECQTSGVMGWDGPGQSQERRQTAEQQDPQRESMVAASLSGSRPCRVTNQGDIRGRPVSARCSPAGKQRALVALGRTVLVIAYHILKQRRPYRDLGAMYFDKLEQHRVEKRLVHRLECLGYQVILQPSAVTG